MQQDKSIWTLVGYYGIIYVILVAIIVVGYPFAQQYAKPIAALIFPIAGNNSLPKNILVVTGMYWGTILVVNVLMKPPKNKS